MKPDRILLLRRHARPAPPTPQHALPLDTAGPWCWFRGYELRDMPELERLCRRMGWRLERTEIGNRETFHITMLHMQVHALRYVTSYLEQRFWWRSHGFGMAHGSEVFCMGKDTPELNTFVLRALAKEKEE